jgi:hypothetical protein
MSAFDPKADMAAELVALPALCGGTFNDCRPRRRPPKQSCFACNDASWQQLAAQAEKNLRTVLIYETLEPRQQADQRKRISRSELAPSRASTLRRAYRIVKGGERRAEIILWADFWLWYNNLTLRARW